MIPFFSRRKLHRQPDHTNISNISKEQDKMVAETIQTVFKFVSKRTLPFSSSSTYYLILTTPLKIPRYYPKEARIQRQAF
jgi:hypothetical protein